MTPLTVVLHATQVDKSPSCNSNKNKFLESKLKKTPTNE
jgi:hypothetical protein